MSKTNRAGDLYHGLLEAIGQRSLPKSLGNCIAGETFSQAGSEQFRSALPFPHVVLDSFLTPEYCQQLLDEFPPFHPKYAVDENGAIGGKASRNDIREIGPGYRKLDDLIQTRSFLDLMSAISGIPDLIYDPEYLGGGTHENLDGQSLDFHVDFNYHHIHRWHRRINLILFLNEHWEADWGGCLELRESPGDISQVIVPPGFNRAVIFETNEVSWHGFPKICLPKDTNLSRKSIALYFYTSTRPAEEKAPARSTIYVEESMPDHLVEGHKLDADDMALLRSLIDRRDSHIARLYRHESDLTAKVYELEGQGSARLKRLFNSWTYSITARTQGIRQWMRKEQKKEGGIDYPFVQFSNVSARRHMMEGWGQPETSMVWSLGAYSILELSFQKCGALNLHFECRPFSYPNAPTQSISIFLNDTLQGTMELTTEKRAYSLPLDPSHQRVGSNKLRFEYGYTRSPADVGDSTDGRELAVAWFNLWLADS